MDDFTPLSYKKIELRACIADVEKRGRSLFYLWFYQKHGYKPIESDYREELDKLRKELDKL